LDPLPATVPLRLLSDRKGVDGAAPIPALVGDRVAHRVGAHGEAADRRGLQPRFGEKLEAEPTDEHLTFGVHRGPSAIHVVAAPRTGGENEVAHSEGSFAEELQKALPVTHAGWERGQGLSEAGCHSSRVPGTSCSSRSRAAATAGDARGSASAGYSRNSMKWLPSRAEWNRHALAPAC